MDDLFILFPFDILDSTNYFLSYLYKNRISINAAIQNSSYLDSLSSDGVTEPLLVEDDPLPS